MILDDNTISLDSESLASGEVTGKGIPLTSLNNPGRALPIHFAAFLVGEAGDGATLTLKLQQAEADEDGDYEDVAGSEVTATDLKPGKLCGWRFVPLGVTKPWFRVVATPSGDFSDGAVFAGVVREENFPYKEGMYIDKGMVIA